MSHEMNDIFIAINKAEMIHIICMKISGSGRYSVIHGEILNFYHIFCLVTHALVSVS